MTDAWLAFRPSIQTALALLQSPLQQGKGSLKVLMLSIPLQLKDQTPSLQRS